MSPNFSGIYRITNSVNGKFYIGSAVRIAYRWATHRFELRHGRHPNPKLHAAWKKYGEAAFQFSVEERVEDLKNLIDREQFYLDTLSPEYNILRKAGSLLGFRFSPESRARLSVQRMGKKHSPEACEKIAQAFRGKPRPPHVQALLRTMQSGKSPTPATIQKIVAKTTGRKHSSEWCQKISQGLRGNKNALGATFNRGRRHTPEARAKMTATHLARWARIKNGETL